MTTGSQPAPISAPPATAISALLANLDTIDLETIASAAIDILDARAGDADLEDDDPCGDALDRGEHSSDDGRAISGLRLRYGQDQSRGPLVNGGARRATATLAVAA